jgi:trehalose 6-phosphate phosphatase
MTANTDVNRAGHRRRDRLVLRGADHLSAFLAAAARAPARVALFCDVDGTISPIAPTPAEALIPAATRQMLCRLTAVLGLVAFVSGRDVLSARRMVGVDGAVYVGGHGLETLTDDGRVLSDPRAEPFVPRMQELLASSRTGLQAAGVFVEDKRTILGAHYRTAPDPSTALSAIEALLAGPARAAGLRLATGHFMVEVRPPVDVSKGDAVLRLLRDADHTAALSAGDDLTDCTAFAALREWASGDGRRSACAVAAVTAETPEEVRAESDVWVAATPGVAAVLRALLDAVGAG